MFLSKYCVTEVLPDKGVTQLFQEVPFSVFEHLSPGKQCYENYW